MKHMNIGEMMTNRAYLTPDMEGYVGGKRYTFNHMNQRVNQFAAYLTNRNIKKGERIALLCKNNEEFITAFFAAARSEEHTSELQSRGHLVCRLLLDIKTCGR